VILCEQDDLASHTSSASTKLIHGGLRYLEHGEIAWCARRCRSGRCSCARRRTWCGRCGCAGARRDDAASLGVVVRLWLYDILAGRSDCRRPVASTWRAIGWTGTEGRLSDWIRIFGRVDDDARLVVTVAIDARDKGARIFTRTRLTRAQRDGLTWVADAARSDRSEVRIFAKALVNATGPWPDVSCRMCARPDRRAGCG